MIISSWVVNYSNFTPYIANFYISYADFLFKRKSLKTIVNSPKKFSKNKANDPFNLFDGYTIFKRRW